MKKEKWNPADWQGRTRKQVESTNTIMAYTFMGVVIALVSMFVVSIL